MATIDLLEETLSPDVACMETVFSSQVWAGWFIRGLEAAFPHMCDRYGLELVRLTTSRGLLGRTVYFTVRGSMGDLQLLCRWLKSLDE